METVTHDGRETAYRITRPDAEGPTTLYVHGSGADHKLWVHQYAPNGPAHPAVAIDLSGHGESDDVSTEPGPDTLEAYAVDVSAVGRKTGADVLVGNSLGGAVVFQVLLEEEFEPSGAVFAGTGAKLAVHERIRRLLTEDFEGAIDLLHQPSYLFADADAETVEGSRQSMHETGGEVTRRDFLTCHAFDVRDRLGEIGVPSLALVGESDQLTPRMYHEFLADELPDCDLAVVERAAHLAMLEEPEAFNAPLETFLDDKVAPT